MQVIFNVVIKVTGVGRRVHHAGVKCRHVHSSSPCKQPGVGVCSAIQCWVGRGGDRKNAQLMSELQKKVRDPVSHKSRVKMEAEKQHCRFLCDHHMHTHTHADRQTDIHTKTHIHMYTYT